MSDQWHYMGDINLEQGGLFYQIEDVENGTNTALQVFAAPDQQISPDPEEWVILHGGHIFVSDGDMEEALATCGYEGNAEGIQTPVEGELVTGDEAKRLIIEAFHAYRGVEDATQTYVTAEELAGRSLAEFVRDQGYLGDLPVNDGPEKIDPPAPKM